MVKSFTKKINILIYLDNCVNIWNSWGDGKNEYNITNEYEKYLSKDEIRCV